MPRKVFEVPPGFEPVPGVPGRWVSRDGLVFSRTGGVIPGSFNSAGYRQVKVRHREKGQKPSTMLVHRMVAMTFIPNPDAKTQINHIDGVKTNNAVANLEWATAQENTVHCQTNGLRYRHAITTEQALDMRRLAALGAPHAYLALRFGVDRYYVASVVYNRTHKGTRRMRTNPKK